MIDVAELTAALQTISREMRRLPGTEEAHDPENPAKLSDTHIWCV